MKRRITSMAIIAALALMAGYNPETGTARVEFSLSALNPSGVVRVPVENRSGYPYLECVWNTGDTSLVLKIDTPGVYICSLKDVWQIGKAYISKGVFIRGFPDTVITDTLVGGKPYPGWQPEQVIRNYKLNKNGTIVEQSYIDTCYYNGQHLVYTESKPRWMGFWSGIIDTIVITGQVYPLQLEAKSLLINNKEYSIRKWYVSQQ